MDTRDTSYLYFVLVISLVFVQTHLRRNEVKAAGYGKNQPVPKHVKI